MKKMILLSLVSAALIFTGCGSSGGDTYVASGTKNVNSGETVPLTNGDVVIVSGDNSGVSSVKSVSGGVIVTCDAGGDCDVTIGTGGSDPTADNGAGGCTGAIGEGTPYVPEVPGVCDEGFWWCPIAEVCNPNA